VLNRPQASPIEHRLRWAGFLIAVGLVIQLTTFIWVHPLAFIAFIVIGCPLVGAGVLLYLYSLVSQQPSQESPE
jgi:hydrogenase/urease accessory protein HupE